MTLFPGDGEKVVKDAWGKQEDPKTGGRVNDHSALVYNANLAITGIPEEVQDRGRGTA